MTATVSVHATGERPDADLEQRVAGLESRLAALEDAISQAGDTLSRIALGGPLGAGGARRKGTAAGNGQRRDEGRGDSATDAFNAGLSAAAKAVRSLMSEVQNQWSPRRRT